MKKGSIINDYSKVILLDTHFHEDERGMFLKVFSHHTFKFNVKQINYVTTNTKNTLRGLHYQSGKNAEAKIFKVIKGKIQVAFVDLRKNSDTYLKWGSFVLDKPEESLFIPKGYATGYLTLSKSACVLYLSDHDYVPESEKGIRWNDPAFNIKWNTGKPILSAKDKLWKEWNG